MKIRCNFVWIISNSIAMDEPLELVVDSDENQQVNPICGTCGGRIIGIPSPASERNAKSHFWLSALHSSSMFCLCSKQSNHLARSIIKEKYRAKQISGVSPDWRDFHRIGSEFFIPDTDVAERQKIKLLFYRLGFMHAHLLFEDR